MESEVPSKSCGNNCPILNNTISFNVLEAHNPMTEVIRESLSTGNLEDINSSPNRNSVSLSNENLEAINSNLEPNSGNGYISNGLLPNGRKKANQWTKEEHQLFLMGLEFYGKGEWKMIAENYVTTRTPIQVASHAQKYFARLAAAEDQKIKTSIFDAPLQVQRPIAILDGNGQQNCIVGSFIPEMAYPYGPITTMLPYHPPYMYQPQAHGPFPFYSSTEIEQTPEAAQISSSSSATSVYSPTAHGPFPVYPPTAHGPFPVYSSTAHGPFPVYSSTGIEQTPEAAQISSSSSATSVYSCAAHGPFPVYSSTGIEQTPEAAQISSSSSATSVDLKLRLSLG